MSSRRSSKQQCRDPGFFHRVAPPSATSGLWVWTGYSCCWTLAWKDPLHLWSQSNGHFQVAGRAATFQQQLDTREREQEPLVDSKDSRSSPGVAGSGWVELLIPTWLGIATWLGASQWDICVNITRSLSSSSLILAVHSFPIFFFIHSSSLWEVKARVPHTILDPKVRTTSADGRGESSTTPKARTDFLEQVNDLDYLPQLWALGKFFCSSISK